MRFTLALCALAVVLTGCVSQGTEIGDRSRVEFPPYDGPKLKVVVVDLENEAEDPRYSELHTIGTSVLKTELGRSGSIRLQGREKMDAVIQEWELSDTGVSNVEGGGAAGPVPQRPDVLIYGKIQAFNSGYENKGVAIIHTQRTQVAEAKVAIFVKNMHTLELNTNYGVGKASKTTGSGILGGSSSTYDRNLAERALRMAIYDCWTRMMEQMKTVNPGTPAGE